MTFTFSELADQDLQAIAYYIALDNPQAAKRVAKSIIDTCQMVAEMPTLGRTPAFLDGDDVYCINVKKYDHYLIVYELRDQGIEVIRILHGARDLPHLYHNEEL